MRVVLERNRIRGAGEGGREGSVSMSCSMVGVVPLTGTDAVGHARSGRRWRKR